MQIAQKMAGYSLGGADLLRRAMGKKIAAEMEAQRDIFTEGAIERGIDPAKAKEVFDLMAKFADYGFNKSHAAAYALVAYQTAWLKANHPEVFLAACMSLALKQHRPAGGAEAGSGALGHPDPAARHQPLRRRFLGRTDGRRQAGDPLRAGRGEEGRLRGHGGAGRGARRPAVRRPRRLRRPGRSEAAQPDAAREPGPRRRLRPAGAEPRAPVRRRRDDPAPRAGRPRRRRKAARSACSAASPSKPEPLRLPDMPDWPPLERLAFEAEAIGFHLTAHPLDAYAQALRRLGVTPCDQVEARAGRQRAREDRRHCGRAKERHHPHRQPHGLGAHLRCRRARRGHAVQRGAGARPRAAGARVRTCWSPPNCGRMARRCASPRRMWRRWIRRRRRWGRDPDLAARDAPVRIFATCSGAKAAAAAGSTPVPAIGEDAGAWRSPCRAASMLRRGWRRR